jgi:hypothetical protein
MTPNKAVEFRIGDRVRSLVDDKVNIRCGLEGLVVNVAPPRYKAPARLRVLWSNDCVSMIDAPTVERVTKQDNETQNVG